MTRKEALVLTRAALASILKDTGKENFYGTIYKMVLSKDRFVHFTTKERAEQILASGKLLMRPPYEKFGADHVAAVSTVWGSYVPGVQTTHIKGATVAVLFKTRLKPDAAFPEEVTWKKDVPLTHVKIVSTSEGIRMLKNADSPDDDFQVVY